MKKTTIIKDKYCEVYLIENAFDLSMNEFNQLKEGINWRKDKIRIFGKEVYIPRHQAWFADHQKLTYKYSSIKLSPLFWNDELLKIKNMAQKTTGEIFNSALVNLYETGKDYAAWHSDNEKELGENPTIASVSFGATRSFHLRHLKNNHTYKINLPHNSILLMKGATQHIYKHQLAKTAKPVGPRINITFRYVRLSLSS